MLCTLALVPAARLTYAYVTSGVFILMNVATVYAVYYTSITLSIVLYRLSPFHPLADVPGPLLNKITKLTGMWHSYTGRQHVVNRAQHEKYGPFVRTGERG